MSSNKKYEGSLASLFTQKSKTVQSLDTINSLFSQKIPKTIEEEAPAEETPIIEEEPYIDENASALVNKDRSERTIFVGNVDLNAKKKDIRNFFTKFGELEKIWERSLPVNSESKLPLKAKAIVKDFAKNIDNPTKNCYILFTEKENALKALEANNQLFLGRHLRVDSCGQEKVQVPIKFLLFLLKLFKE